MKKPILSTLTLRIKDQKILDAIEKHKDSSEYINTSSDAIYDMVKEFDYYKKSYFEYYQKVQDLELEKKEQRNILKSFSNLIKNC